MKKPDEKIRLVAFDLDGTTLSGHAALSERNRRAMERAAEAGVLLVPATGRVKNFLPESVRALPFIRYAITSNGGAVWNMETGEPVFQSLIDNTTACAVQAIFSGYDLFVEYYVNGRAVTRRGDLGKVATVFGIPKEKFYFLTKDYLLVDDVGQYLRETRAEPEKINMMFIPEAVRAEILERLRGVENLALTFSNVDNIEINRAGCDKGAGLLALCEALGLSAAQTLAVGDNGNDLGMLRAAGFAAVVGNGIEAAKNEADALVAPCAEDGFAEAVERFAL